MHRGVLDLENLGPVLDRLIAMDRKKVYVSLGYLNVLNPLYIDNIDFEVDFQKEDEKNLLRALVDLSMAFPMDLIRIDSTKSDVLVIYSMYQSNSVLPQTGRIFFRYVSHPFSSKMELIKARMPMFKHFLTMVRLEQFAQKFFTENVTTT
jgi:hypothetical protein